ncbi:MAG: acetyl-CoA carboxylase biotin carboxylase subunit [Candidatus Tectomicrobia bacterium]|nr:acetyl-CoA carboxylase biotin carboxylase subunit [Candidatus Tectomicrobia bacterium]
MFRKVLVANRGEIAVRILRALRDLGIASATIYSEVDRNALHVRYADEAYLVGPSPSTQSYLCLERILEVAKKCGADALHPGYGFLAENAEFARRCAEAGITFVGPPAEAIASMGSKTEARALAMEAKVPVVPGTATALRSETEAARLADDIGLPLVVKAVAGGGGKGMRVVSRREDLPGALRAARSEAASAFGDDTIYLERYLERPRHIEIQVLGDQHGNLIHLGERECSVQRRHQKVIEESPSAIITPELRNAMGEAALRLCRKVGYFSAGTVEFLVDGERNFYFLEMNTRLQVEHPVTEAVTGIDLVEAMLRIAAGEPLGLRQEEVRWLGHAIECRIYAEDPRNGFLPSPGRIEVLRAPGGPGVRDDSGVYEGFEVPIYYDPLISKLVTWGPDRATACRRMQRALREYVVVGIATTIPFHQEIMNHSAFLAGEIDTNFIEREFELKEPAPDPQTVRVAILAAAIDEHYHELRLGAAAARTNGRGVALPAWRLAGRQAQLQHGW